MSEPFVWEEGPVPCFRIPFLEDTGRAKAVFSSRLGGVSPEPWKSMDLSWNRGDSAANVRANYIRFCEARGWDPAMVAQCHAVHKTDVLEVEDGDLGGILREENMIRREADGLITDRPGVILKATFADCVPIWLLDPILGTAGMLHAGWRGTVNGMAQKGVQALSRAYGSKPENVLAVIGPCIHSCCFEIKNDVAEPLSAAFPEGGPVRREADGRLFGDLPKCNQLFLQKAGVLPEHIAVSGLCTADRTDVFFSHRAEHGKCGVMAGMIVLI